jgi:sugar lactone lactonase YvrE
MTDVDVAVRARAELGEGPRWIAGRLLWVDILAGTLHRSDPATGSQRSMTFDDALGMVAPRGQGGLLAAVGRSVVLLDEDSEEVARVDLPDEPPDNRVNDGRCDPAGRLWIGTMRADGDGAAGSLYRVDPDLSVRRVATDLGISNGIDWSPDGERMYHVDSATGRVDVYDFEVRQGLASGRRTLVAVPGDQGVPDGLVVDAEGGVWVAFHGGWAVRRYTPDGRLDREVPMPVAQPTAVAFGGEDLADLYVTTATEGLDAGDLEDQPLAGSVLRLRPGVTGRPTTPFAG